MFKAGAREMDRKKSGLYLRYHLIVYYLLENKKIPAEDLFYKSYDLELLESEIMALEL